jgi:hypothetical protein
LVLEEKFPVPTRAITSLTNSLKITSGIEKRVLIWANVVVFVTSAVPKIGSELQIAPASSII